MLSIFKYRWLQKGLAVIALLVPLYITVLCQGLIVTSGTSLVADNGNIVLKGDLVNNGSFINNTSTVVFSGTTQSLEGSVPIIFNNLSVTSSSTTTIVTSGQSIRGILLSNGTLNANGYLTLLSSATQTALIDGSGTGTVIGNVTMERYLPSKYGYKYFSSPFQGATVNEFGDDMDLLASFPSLYKYDETRVSSGWVKYIEPAGVLNPVNGYAVNFGITGTPATVDVSGVVNNGALSRIMYNNNNNTYTKGFNLVGNPYPSPIDWVAAAGWTKTAIDNALYFFKASGNQYSGTYSTYINGTSSDGLATKTIPSMQAFFVHVTDGSFPVTGTLAMDNRVRITDLSHSFIKGIESQEKSFLRLAASYSDDTASCDPTVIYFDEKAENKFDSGLDALKLMNTDILVPNLYTIAVDGNNLSINALPVTDENLLVIPVGLKTEKNGTIEFRITDAANLPSDTQIYLHDEETGADQSLDLNSVYNINLNAGEYKARFSLRFIKGTTGVPENVPGKEMFTIYSSYGSLMADINLLPGKRGALIINNIAGQQLFRKEIYHGGYQEFKPQLKPGIYIISFIIGNTRDSKKIVILNQ